MELQNEAKLANGDRLMDSLRGEAQMAPTFENMNLLSASVGHGRLLEMYKRQQADRRRVYEGTLLQSLANLEQ